MDKLSATWDLNLPNVFRARLQKIFTNHNLGLLMVPEIDWGKVVVERDYSPRPTATHIVRACVTATFGLPAEQDITARIDDKLYSESWMGVMMLKEDSVNSGVFDILLEELYVHRNGGWERVWANAKRFHSPERSTVEGDQWPEPAGEAPTNKAALTSLLNDSENPTIVKALNDLVAAGAVQTHDEYLVDMTDDVQRRAFWTIHRELRRP